MESLELKHLSPYLPYELKAISVSDSQIRTVTLLHFTYDLETVGHNHLIYKGIILNYHKLILRPLSDVKYFFLKLWSEGDKDTRNYFDADYLGEFNIDADDTDFSNIRVEYLPYGLFNLLAKNHFDLFDLIPKGLAIDINTINP